MLLRFQILRPVIPIADFFRQAIFDCCNSASYHLFSPLAFFLLTKLLKQSESGRFAVDTLKLTSFSQYTPQHFARYGYDSRLNRLKYSNQPRLGFGVDAVSRIDGMITRNTQDVAAYVQTKGDPAGTIVSVDPISMEDVERANLQDALFNLKEIDLKLINSSLRERVIELLARGLDLAEAVRQGLGQVHGTYGIAVLDRENPHLLLAARAIEVGSGANSVCVVDAAFTRPRSLP